jgi:hypothetical protein
MRASILLGLLAACAAPAPLPDHAPRPVHELAVWELTEEGQPVGRLLLLEIEDPAGPQRWYRVENRGRQWVGWVSPAGRFWRRVPFAEQEQFVGVYPMAEGLRLLLELERPVAIHAVPSGGAREAAHARETPAR